MISNTDETFTSVLEERTSLRQSNEEKDKQLIENEKTIQILQADVFKKDNIILALQLGQNQQIGKLVEKEKTIEEYQLKINNLLVDVNNKDNRISALQFTVNSYASTLQSKDSQLSQAQSKVNTLQAELNESKSHYQDASHNLLLHHCHFKIFY